jgi:hypothetical protein
MLEFPLFWLSGDPRNSRITLSMLALMVVVLALGGVGDGRVSEIRGIPDSVPVKLLRYVGCKG